MVYILPRIWISQQDKAHGGSQINHDVSSQGCGFDIEDAG